MRHLALAVVLIGATSACSGEGASDPNPPPAPEVGRFILKSVAGQSLPAAVVYCQPTCSGSRLVYPDTFEIEVGAVQRFKWAVSFSEDSTAALQRIIIVGSLVVSGSGLALAAENHPVLPASIFAGLFYRNPSTGVYDLHASPPWRSGGLTEFRYERLSP